MSVKHIGDLKKTECYGCSACVYSCPFGAITMEQDREGFRYPVVDEEKCTGCGKCRKICPSICPKDMSNAPEPESYAVWAEDNVRRDSSSGGFFTVLARSVFAQGGVVCGVVTDEDFKVFHTVATNEKEFVPMRGSKYVQSDLRDIFPKVKEFLGKGKKVLFTGTPCQVAAIKRCTRGKFEENLFMIDIICHGVPSLKFFNDYLQVEKTKKKMDIQKFIFRDKKYGWGKKGSICGIKKGNTVTELVNSRTSSYYSLFNDGEVFRDCCYKCPFAQEKRVGDLTIGDYWGVEKFSPEVMEENGGDFSKKNGVSCLMINTDKGKEMLACYGENIRKIPVDIEKIKIINTQLNHPVKHTYLRDIIFKVYTQNGYKGVEKIYRKQLVIRKVKSGLKRVLKFIGLH